MCARQEDRLSTISGSFHKSGEAAKQYNILQKRAYLGVIFFLLPLMILMGLGMSPALDALRAGWVDIFFGRQSIRTLHFIIAWALVLFAAIHVFEVVVTGLWNNLRSMITGYIESNGRRIMSTIEDKTHPARSSLQRLLPEQDALVLGGCERLSRAPGSRSCSAWARKPHIGSKDTSCRERQWPRNSRRQTCRPSSAATGPRCRITRLTGAGRQRIYGLPA